MGNRSRQYCEHCDEWTMAEREGLGTGAHIVHAVITLFSVGLWALVWLLHAVLSPNPPRCTTCGSKSLLAPSEVEDAEGGSGDKTATPVIPKAWVHAGIVAIIALAILFLYAWNHLFG